MQVLLFFVGRRFSLIDGTALLAGAYFIDHDQVLVGLLLPFLSPIASGVARAVMGRA
jgi:hypothetical protein